MTAVLLLPLVADWDCILGAVNRLVVLGGRGKAAEDAEREELEELEELKDLEELEEFEKLEALESGGGDTTSRFPGGVVGWLLFAIGKGLAPTGIDTDK